NHYDDTSDTGGHFLPVFLKAADGIRYSHVTGVQTCALPIWKGAENAPDDSARPLAAARFGRRGPGPLSLRARRPGRAHGRCLWRDRKSVVEGKSADTGGRCMHCTMA